MAIEWFPGHMATARRQAAEAMRATDVVIEVLDARVPAASRSPLVEELRAEQKRPVLRVLNKSDAADPKETARWLRFYDDGKTSQALALSAKKPGDARRIVKAAAALAPGRGTHVKPLRMMILGIPNVGKSTLLNALVNAKVAAVGDQPAITKQPMRRQIAPGTWITDTPGMLWPGLGDDVGWKLAATHSIGPNAYDEGSVAVVLGDHLLARYPALVAQRYGALPDGCDGNALLAHIAAVRHIVVDKEGQAARTFLNEFRGGILGRITLETVDDPTTKPLSSSP